MPCRAERREALVRRHAQPPKQWCGMADVCLRCGGRDLALPLRSSEDPRKNEIDHGRTRCDAMRVRSSGAMLGSDELVHTSPLHRQHGCAHRHAHQALALRYSRALRVVNKARRPGVAGVCAALPPLAHTGRRAAARALRRAPTNTTNYGLAASRRSEPIRPAARITHNLESRMRHRECARELRAYLCESKSELEGAVARVSPRHLPRFCPRRSRVPPRLAGQ